MVALLLEDWRLPSCGLACTRERVVTVSPAPALRQGAQWRVFHDPQAHGGQASAVLAGLLVALWLRAPGPSDVIATGPLIVDFIHERVAVDGRERPLSPTEWRILARLARRLDCVCEPIDLYVWAWPNGVDRRRQPAAERNRPLNLLALLRAHIERLRRKLGAAGHLIVTQPACGYRLRAEPPIGATE